MAHARRKFDEAMDNDRDRAEYALMRMQQLYGMEGILREHAATITDQEIIGLRKEKAIPILNELERWMKENLQQVLPKSPIGIAIQYTLGRWEKLCRYTENAALQIDNNLVENAIRPVAIGRKNYLFAGSHEGAERAAMIYSFFGTCKLNGVNPQHWLADILIKINNTKTSQLSKLLPANWKAANTNINY